MGEATSISWCDSTWNAWIGCQKVGPGCDHCYAETLNNRFGGGNWGPHAQRRRTSVGNWDEARLWQRTADAFVRRHGHRRRVFCGSMMDIADNAVPIEWAHAAFSLMEECDGLNWLPLTKRIRNIGKRVPDHWTRRGGWPKHVGLMITVVNQEEADRDIPVLLEQMGEYTIPWVGLSMEPLLGPVDLTPHLYGRATRCSDCPADGDCCCGYDTRRTLTGEPYIGWVIAGGESGKDARPMHPNWARFLRDQCATAGVPFHKKQWGEWAPYDPESPVAPLAFVDLDGNEKHDPTKGDLRRAIEQAHQTGSEPWALMQRIGKKAAGRLLDGIEYNGLPEALALG